MTDEEIVARGLMRAKLDGAVVCAVEWWEGSRGRVEHAPVMVIDYDALAASVLAALREAGRLVPAGGEHWGLLVSALRDAETMAGNDENEARAEAIRALRLELTP